MDKTYSIVRFFKNGEVSQIIERGLSLAEAQEHCKREDTSTDEYFDGYNEE